MIVITAGLLNIRTNEYFKDLLKAMKYDARLVYLLYLLLLVVRCLNYKNRLLYSKAFS